MLFGLFYQLGRLRPNADTRALGRGCGSFPDAVQQFWLVDEERLHVAQGLCRYHMLRAKVLLDVVGKASASLRDREPSDGRFAAEAARHGLLIDRHFFASK
jgi:hypothetical protein